MLVKLTSKNQLTLPKAATDAVGPVQYFDVAVREGQIVLTPLRLQRGDPARAKLAQSGLSDADVADALTWARRAAPVAAPDPVAAKGPARAARKRALR